MRINVSISKKDLEKIDEYCKITGISRSAIMVRGTLEKIGVFDSKTVLETPAQKVAPKSDKWSYKPCKHGLDPKLCKDRKCRKT